MDDCVIIDILQKSFGHTEESAKNIVEKVNNLVSKHCKENNCDASDECYTKVMLWKIIFHIVDQAKEAKES